MKVKSKIIKGNKKRKIRNNLKIICVFRNVLFFDYKIFFNLNYKKKRIKIYVYKF